MNIHIQTNDPKRDVVMIKGTFSVIDAQRPRNSFKITNLIGPDHIAQARVVANKAGLKLRNPKWVSVSF